ncbi:MAG: kelch repeat-containing protein [Bacteroidota bacterium]
MNHPHQLCCEATRTTDGFGRNRQPQPFVFLALFLFSLFGLPTNYLVAQSPSFSKTTLFGANLSEPTSLDFGPDEKLYVSERTGLIYIYTIEKNGNNYQVVSTEVIDLVKNITNHNDNGEVSPTVNSRQVTGILVVGTPENPIIYVSSSDIRVGGGGLDTNLDTNSGIVSRLTKVDSVWTKVDLIRGLPRSEENHATNGMQYDAATNSLFVAQGGHTNAGAPSANFVYIGEYALSSAILQVDLTQLDTMPILTDSFSGQQYVYDIPTLDDPTRPNDASGNDINDPFGGNDGLNQAKYVPGGPIFIYARGFRNQYDLVLTQLGNLYTWDNGANQGIGGHPNLEGTPNVNNAFVIGEPGSNGPGPNDGQVNNKDGLHKVPLNYYAGHPNPARANPLGAGIFTHESGPGENGILRVAITGNPATSLPVDYPPYPESLKDLREGDFQNAGISDSSIFIIEASTNGMAEYTATTFGGVLQGDLLAASFSGDIFTVDLDANGNLGPDGVTSIANQLEVPIDVATLPNNSAFAGTVWVVEFSGGKITVLEPSNNETCIGTDDDTIDEDEDGYTNADEIQNGSDPCNPAITPADFDGTLIGGFKVSNLNDPDDDDDGLLDTEDPFAQDPFNGLNTTLPLVNRLANGTSGLLDLGFTGLMTNGTTDYLELIDNENAIIAGGAPELLVIPQVADGTALNSVNNEVNAFQFGIKVDTSTAAFTVTGKIVPPFLSNPAFNNQRHGMYIGTGDQDNYLKIVLKGNTNGNSDIQVIHEVAGVATIQTYSFSNLQNATDIKVGLSVNPENATVQPLLSVNGSNSFPLGTGPVTTTGDLQAAIQSETIGLAVGITANATEGDTTFTAIWDNIDILFNDPNTLIGQWETINDGQNCAVHGSPGSCPAARHESGYIEAGDRFYMFGGRETQEVNIYDPTTDIWTKGANMPINMHHFQAVEYEGLIYIMGAFSQNPPLEAPVPNIYIYDPAADAWTVGPPLPANRLRGAAAAVVYKGKIYLAGGIQNGHIDGRVSWLDEYDPHTNTWAILPDAPNERDHIQAIIFEDKMYLVSGKQTGEGNSFNATIDIVDVYDFDNQTWSSLPNPIPTPRGGHSVALLGNELLVIGGENDFNNSINKTEALNLNDNTWRALPNLNQGRHGTQAVVNNGVIYIAAGSPVPGGGNSKSQEAFYFTQKNVPVFTPIAPSILTVEGENLNAFNTLDITSNSDTLVLKNRVGNQGIIIDDIELVEGTDNSFSVDLENGATLPLVLATGDSLLIIINTSSPTFDSLQGGLIITHSGANAPITEIILNEEVCLDLDGDGFCGPNDCDDNDPTIPAIPGTICDDGNPNSDNDVIQEDGCTCQGNDGVIADCNGVLFQGGNGEIRLKNLFATSEIVEIIGEPTNYQVIEICNGNCADEEVISNLFPGEYNVKLNMFGSDNSYCFRQETVIVSSGPCIDNDNDGICANADCDDNNPLLPATPGDTCNDGDSLTINDVYLGDGCTCQGTTVCQIDVDNDGVCADEDCDDNDPTVPAVPGTICNDNDPATTGDVYQADGCKCQGNNGDGTANCEAVQLTGDAGQIIVSNLTAASEKIEIIGAPTNWQVVLVCDGDCANPLVIPNLSSGDYTVKINMFGSDNSYCYDQKDVTVTDEPCTDADNDGVCVADDCDDNDPTVPAIVGSICNDGDSTTINDVYQADGCTCQGVFTCPSDADGDGVCTEDDCDDNSPNIPAQPGTICNDGNPLTANDVIQSDGCTCVGVPCTDADNDGICAEDDCDDNDPNLPNQPGAICNDNDPNTTGDVYQADGCTCAGIGGGPANCDNVQFIGGNGIITLTNLTAASEAIEIIGAPTNWVPVLICAEEDACSNPYVIPNLTSGTYTVKLQMFGDDNSYCYRQENVVVSDGPCTDLDDDGVCAELDCDDNNPLLPATPGDSCNDGDTLTINDIYLADGCTCQGTVVCAVDADNDGVCAADDCDDTNPNIPTQPGTICNDNDPETQNDQIQLDGCTCAGSNGGPANCDNVQFTDGAGQITLSNLSALGEKIEIIGAPTNWQVVLVCDMDCDNVQVIPNLSPGVYTVKLQMFGDDNSYCYRQENVTVTAPAANATAINRNEKFFTLDAFLSRNVVKLQWADNIAMDGDEFLVERSSTVDNFEVISKELPKQKRPSANSYQREDANPLLGTNYYRVKLQRADGSALYTPFKKIIIEQPLSFNVFPNPAQTEVFIGLRELGNQPIDIRITNQLGKLVYEEKVNPMDNTAHRINIENFENGVYFIQIRTSERRLVTKKLLVTRLY